MIVHDFTKATGEVVERWPSGPHEMVRMADGRIMFRCVSRTWVGDDGPEMTVAPLNISQHTVTWEPGGVPTVSPSILVNGDTEAAGPGAVRVHGFITAGVWAACSDDLSVALP